MIECIIKFKRPSVFTPIELSITNQNKIFLKVGFDHPQENGRGGRMGGRSTSYSMAMGS